MPENQLDSIKVIGDGISALNQRLADMLPTADGFDELEKQRDLALARQNFLIKIFFKDSAKRFISATDDLATVTDQMSATLANLTKIETTITNVTRFVNAIGGFVDAVVHAT